MAGAVLAAMVLTLLLPADVRPGPSWLLPSIEGALLVAVIATDPGRITRRSNEVRRPVDRARHGARAQHALGDRRADRRADQRRLDHQLRERPARSRRARSVWLSNCIAFALLYWELDGGGAAARAHQLPAYPDLAFPQQSNPRLAVPGWRPRFVDYLYLGVTNATALSPTDVMPLVPWAKIAMTVQSVISLAILALVVARAVNVFS